MQVTDTPLVGLKRVQLKLHRDDRGFFVERFHARNFANEALPAEFSQQNHSRSVPGVVRGLHFQYQPPQGKLVGVVNGRVWDVAVDVRPWSLTFGQYYAEELSADNGVMLWVPPGFAHGFCVLGGEPADMVYCTDAYYAPDGESGIRFDDAELGIKWPVENPLVSARDRALQSWAEYCARMPMWEAE